MEARLPHFLALALSLPVEINFSGCVALHQNPIVIHRLRIAQFCQRHLRLVLNLVLLYYLVHACHEERIRHYMLL